ncbi:MULTISPECIES: hypothetical protein [Haloferax]|uniref:Uncharacterized protein n=2 Tax=Haloferax TaxID=2251 RepID=A0A6G1Z6Z3_9EURY|nr:MULTISPECIES: hypothetical protein [Haloferax]KAB1185135.1 hypothetical protein Hfx1149_16580 [Haloferax sp. CBA1149]MRW82312.1 hypothetical protein [Haloferax marinisediminis]
MHVGLVVAKLVTMLLGFLIAYQAYRGYRRNDSQPMFYVAVGFVFISFGAVIEGILFDVVGLSLSDAGTVATIIVAIGMLSVLYALYGREYRVT